RLPGWPSQYIVHGTLPVSSGWGPPGGSGLTDIRFQPLNVIVDTDAAAAAGWPPIDLLRACVAGGARFLQVRAKHLPGAAFLELARAAVMLTRESGGILIINDRADIAKLAGADGVHLGQDDLAPSAARAMLGASAIIGRSTHSVTQIDRAAKEPVDYMA